MRKLVIFIVLLFGFSLCFTPVAGAELFGIERSIELADKYMEADPTLTHLGEQSPYLQEQVEKAIASEEWLERSYNSGALPAEEALAKEMAPEEFTRVEGFAEQLQMELEDIPLDSPAEAAEGADMLGTAESAGLVSGATVAGLATGVAALGYLVTEDIKTGSNPVSNFLVRTFAEEPESEPDIHYGESPAEVPVETRMRNVGGYYEEYKELYGENAEELKLCKGERECLLYVYPWEFAGNSPEGCGKEVSYCGLYAGSGEAAPFHEGDYEVSEARFAHHTGWFLEGAVWYEKYTRFKHYEEITHKVYYTVTSTVPTGATGAGIEEHCGERLATFERGWPNLEPNLSTYFQPPLVTEPTAEEVEKGSTWGHGENPPGNSCEYPVETGQTVKYLSAVGEVVYRKPLFHTHIGLPGRHAFGQPGELGGHSKEDIHEPTPPEVTKKLNKKGAIGPQTKGHIEHALNGGPPVVEPKIPGCAGLSGMECVALIEAAGFSSVELDPLTWETAVVTKPSEAEISTNPQEGSEVSPEENVKVIANPVEMPLVVPTTPSGGETYPDYAKQLEKAGFTDPQSKTLPESGIDTKVGPGDVAQTKPAEGSRVKPDAGDDPVEVDVNPDDAPIPPEMGGGVPPPTEPGIDLPHLTLLCTTFPFGVPCWLRKQLEAFAGTGAAPVWSIGPIEWEGHKIPKVEINLAKLESIMEVVRPFMVIFGGIGIVFLFYKIFTGKSFGGGENPAGQVPNPESTFSPLGEEQGGREGF